LYIRFPKQLSMITKLLMSMQFATFSTKYKSSSFLLTLFCCSFGLIPYAQLPDCINQADLIYILKSNGEILNWNTNTFPSVTNSTNLISAPTNGGFAVCDRLPQRDYKTFYFIGGFPPYYQYHDGTNWVNTGHLAGPSASNITGAGAYIYNLNGINGVVYKYDGTGNDVPILTLPMWGGPFDLAGDSDGNFYVLKTNTSGNTERWLRKYDPHGDLLQQWEIVGGGTSVIGQSLGGCMAIICRDVYFHNGYELYHGTIDSDTVIFTAYGAIAEGSDYGSCERIPKTKIIDSTICYNQLPFIWNEQLISEAGKYQHTIQDLITSCDSTAILNLSVQSNIEITIDSTICQNDLPFIWYEHEIHTIGEYLVSANTTTTFGCDSLTHLKLVVLPITKNEIDTIVCEENLPFSWQTHIVSKIGSHTFIDTFSSSLGCDSLAFFTIHVKETNINTIDSFLCKNDFPFLWKDQIITEVGTYTHTEKSTNGCDSINLLKIKTKCEIEIPNILSLSSKMGNDVWQIKDAGFSEFHCQIINRWGHVVYELNDIHQKWHGDDKKGNKLPEGIYFYIILAHFYDNSSVEKYGFISLER